MRFSKSFTVSVICYGCGKKLDAALGDDNEHDFTIIVDPHVCEVRPTKRALDGAKTHVNYDGIVYCNTCGSMLGVKPPRQ